ncbi:hypothetical protein LZ24_00264 [Desulfobotulus alkaliphilus]|uniref:Tetratricopeptide repeat protein n=1 Tax=Desulfobotulus alkaliphilus TaxID=622671 RepID=A0A562S9I1_9BACT|nr:hypothetical protein [Desulfobotulus alkaliphilus]TWI77454.1 hypothetical protein LZ24_00264 [Desulfobotulus alkaliphilus]
MENILRSFLFLLFFSLSAHAAGPSGCGETDLFDYGLTRYQEKKWDLAVFGLDRFIHACPEDPRSHEAGIYLAIALEKQGKTEAAAELLRHIHRKGRQREASVAALVLASLYAGEGEAGQSVLWAENLLRSTENEDMRTAALWMAGGQYLKAGDFHGAAARWDFLTGEDRREAEGLWLAWQERPEEGRKSPFLAGLFGMVPGGGYFYTGRRQAGSTAFFLTLGMGAASWEAFDQDLPVLGTFLGLITLGFYGGSMKGGMDEARRTSHTMDIGHEAEVLSRFRKEADFPLDRGSIRISLPF